MEIIEKKGNKYQSSNFRLQDLWGMFIPKWYWFVISLGGALSVAVLYIMVTPPLYTRTASILIKDNSKNGSSGGNGDFQDLGIFTNNTNINNELFTIQSPTLMTEVVKRLKLDDTYTIKDGLRSKELYKETPILVTFKHPEKVEGISFTIQFYGKDKACLSDFIASGDNIDKSMDVTIGKSVDTPVGELTLTTTQYYLNTWNDIPIRYAKNGLQGTINHYAALIHADLGDEKVTIINLSIDDPTKQKAEDILNQLIEVYNGKWIQDKNQVAVSTSHFINDRLNVIENELGNVDENISSYKSEHLLPDVQAAANQYMTMSSENKKELLVLNSKLSTAQYIRKELNKQNLTRPLPTNSGIENINIQNQIAEYNIMLLNRNRLLSNSSENNPLVQDLTKSLHSLQTNIVQSVDNAIATINMQINSLHVQESATVSQLASNPRQAKHLLSVERQQKVKEELYLYLLQKREENELSQAFTAYNTRVITAPRGSGAPTYPQQKNLFLIAFTIGLLLPAVIIFAKENLNTCVRGRKDIEALSIPFIGEIPLAREEQYRKKKFGSIFNKASRNQEEHPVVVKEKNRNIINEAFRVVRTNLEFMAGTDNTHKIIMTTSANPSSGKTFVSLNLAISLAIKDKKVLLIDLDMRRASLSKYIGNPKIGLSNYLGGQVLDIKDIIKHDKELTNLDIIPVGTIPPNPTELLFSKGLEEMFAIVRNEYDYVFIDCPPVEIVADASIIGKLADMTLFVVRAGLMDRDMLPVIEDLYSEKKYNNMALLLNGTTAAYGGRYGYHHYGYRYGYHYGYGSYGSKN